MIAALGEMTFVFMRPRLAVNFRTLAHELGHCLDNGWDAPNTRPIFYPAANTFTDDATNSYRRFTEITMNNCRTTRAAGALAATGNRLLKMP